MQEENRKETVKKAQYAGSRTTMILPSCHSATKKEQVPLAVATPPTPMSACVLYYVCKKSLLALPRWRGCSQK